MKTVDMVRSFVAFVVIAIFSTVACLGADAQPAPAAQPAKAATDAKAAPAPAKADAKAATDAKAAPAPAKTDAKTAAAPAKPDEKAAKAAAQPAEPSMALPAGELTIGAGFGDQMFESFADVVLPVLAYKSGIVFINPRGSANDAAEQECNLGLGARYLLPKQEIIVGANVYYDSRWTAHDNQFDQTGVGLELLTKWVDARANYYFADDSKKLADTKTTTEKWDTYSSSTTYSELYGEGNAIMQDTIYTETKDSYTKTSTYQSFEAGMDGWDVEIGGKLPVLEKLAETRLFVGYQSFDNPFGDDLNGITARAEVRPMPGVTLDAKYFEEKDLNGTQYYVGGRVQVPFDVANLVKGKNPFAGTLERFKTGVKPFASRLTEMVIRDMHVQMSQSDYIEDTSKRTTTKQSKVIERDVTENVITNGIAFVDADNHGYENGTYEHPYDTIQEGVDAAAGDPNLDITYVMPDNGLTHQYGETVVVTSGVTVWGSGTPIYGYGGMSFGGGEAPIVNGRGYGPTFTLESDTRLTGVTVINTPTPWGYASGTNDPANYITVPAGSPGSTVTADTTYYVGNAGIVANGANNYQIDNNLVTLCEYGALLIAPEGSYDTFQPLVLGNSFVLNGTGLIIEGRGQGVGAFNPDVIDNTFALNCGNGLMIRGVDYESTDIDVGGNTAVLNGDTGMSILAHSVSSYGGVATIDMWGNTASFNGLQALLTTNTPVSSVDGISATALADNTGNAYVYIAGTTANGNADDGIVALAQTTGSGSADIYMYGNTANGNLSLDDGNTGIDATSVTTGSGNANVNIYNSTAMANNGVGISANAQTMGSGSASAGVYGSYASLNDGTGIRVASAAIGTGSAYATVGGATATANNGTGIDVDATAVAQGATAQAVVYYSTASLNNGAGFDVNVYDGALYSSANLYLGGLTATANNGAGIVVNAFADYTYAYLDWYGSSDASLNNGPGLVADIAGSWYVYASANVNATANNGAGADITVDAFYTADADISGSYVGNNGDGLTVNVMSTAAGYSSPANVDFWDVNAAGNAGNGISATVSSVDGNASASFYDGMLSANMGNGLEAAITSGANAGSATLAIAGLAAVGQLDGNGIRATVTSVDGNASVSLTDVQALANTYDGVDVDVTATGTGDASLDVSGGQFSLNADNGILADVVAANGGEATATFTGGQSSINGLNGIEVNVTDNAGGAPASLTVEDWLAMGNAGNGIDADVTSTSMNGGSAVATFNNVQALANGDNGVRVSVQQTGTGTASLDVNGGTYSANRNDGINASVSTANGTASAELSGAATSLNGDDGVDLTLSETIANDGWLSVSDWVAAANGDNGIVADLSANVGSMSASFVNVVADGNGLADSESAGIWVDVSAGGAASVTFEDVVAAGNAGAGIIADVTSTSLSGASAMATFDNVMAAANGGNGVSVSVQQTGNGSASLDVNDGNYSGNLYDGINAYVSTENGTASAELSGGISSLNGGDGIDLTLSENIAEYGTASVSEWVAVENGNNGILADLNSENGSMSASFNQVIASGNGSAGINVDVWSSGPATVTFQDVLAEENSGDGIVATYYSDMSTASASLDSVDASLNGGDGIRLNGDAAQGIAEANLNDIIAVGNGGDGIDITLASIVDQVSMSDTLASYNGANGIVTTINGAGQITAAYERVVATQNGENGLLVDLTSVDSGVIASFHGVAAVNNAYDGINVTLTATNGTPQLFGEDCILAYNDDDGIDVNLGAAPLNTPVLNFGMISPPVSLNSVTPLWESEGENIVLGNGDYDVQNDTEYLMYIENSFWGENGPVNNYGNVDADPVGGPWLW